MRESESGSHTRQPRRPWADRWLLDAFQRLGFPAAGNLSGEPSDTAWEALARAGASPEQLLETACAVSARQPARLTGVGPAQSELLDRALAERYGVAPVAGHGNRLEVACSNPLHPTLERELEFACGRRISLTVAGPAEVRAARERIYRGEAPAPRPAGTGYGTLPGRFTWVARPQSPGSEEPVPLKGRAVAMLDDIIADGLDQGASDLHFEPKRGGLVVRIRVDGLLHEIADVPADLATSMISRLKILAGLDIADRLRPQDGRAGTVYRDRAVDLRISTLPLGSGEKAVVRILDSRAAALGLDELGFTPGERYRFEKLLGMKEGMVLVTGPTGSGKTTTLYSALRHVHSPETNIVTVEDPIEYRLEGINQVQVHEKSGLTFAAALRSILRQDPDVVLVGEIRDGETANIGIKASMTGHLVLSTLHTNDAPSAVSRLQDIGVDMGALAGALKGVVAQRLVRRLCPHCSAPQALDELTPDQQALLAGQKHDRLRKAVGCGRCRGTGYRGRMVVAEIILITPELQKAVAAGEEMPRIAELARGGGMKSLWESGRDKVVAGWTSIHELLDNVVPPLDDPGHTATPAPAGAVPAAGAAQESIDALIRQMTGAGPAERRGPAAAARSPLAVAPQHGLRLLLIEEDRVQRRALRRALENEGFAVLEAADGEAGLAYARRLAPDVVVCEVALPRLDAAGLLQALRGDASPPPVVVYTDQGDPELLAWLAELGAAEVLLRPAEPGALAALLLARGKGAGRRAPVLVAG